MRLPPALKDFQIETLVDHETLIRSVRASLGFLGVALERITVPLLAAVYRAPFGGADFGVFLTGPMGTFKTALAALCQQHFGAAMDAHGLPGHFASTANALERT